MPSAHSHTKDNGQPWILPGYQRWRTEWSASQGHHESCKCGHLSKELHWPDCSCITYLSSATSPTNNGMATYTPPLPKPEQNLDTYKYQTFCATMIKIQLAAIGTAMKIKLHLRPNVSHIQPTTMVPITPPIPSSEPTQAISGDVNGPVSNGVCSDSSTKNADDVHPNAVPTLSEHRFAKEQK